MFIAFFLELRAAKVPASLREFLTLLQAMRQGVAGFDIDEFYFLANLGVPIRLRFNPTWFPEIDHWKMAIFAGQNIVEFGSANWDSFELAPFLARAFSPAATGRPLSPARR